MDRLKLFEVLRFALLRGGFDRRGRPIGKAIVIAI